MNCKLEVVRYSNSDVISTSHYSIDGMTATAEPLEVGVSNGTVCGWTVTGVTVNGSEFTYYDVDGKKVTTDLQTNGWVDLTSNGWKVVKEPYKFYHYTEDGKYILCNDESHIAD